MEINDIRTKKRELENDIYDLIKKFEVCTDVSISSINIILGWDLNSALGHVKDISIEIKL